MPHLGADDLSAWSGGRWINSKPADISGVSTDTRTLRPGELYVALAGERHDGHAFLPQAFDKKAAAAVVSESFAASAPPSGPLLAVDDTRKALGRLASGYRSVLRTEFIAVTGSIGKTTVKEMAADVLAAIGPTARTRGNWNNDIGLPLSLLQADPAVRFGVFELGMNHAGELQPLCEMLRPSWGLITNAAAVHIEFFGSVDEIAREKAAVFRCLPRDGTAVANRDDPRCDLVCRDAPCRVLTVALGAEADYRARVIDEAGGRFVVTERATGGTAEFQLPLPGRHMVSNALFAIAVGRGHGLGWDRLVECLRAYRPPPLRWNVSERGGVTMVNDAYNANPVSMRAALRAFAASPCKGRRWLVLGGMRELGAVERTEHLELGRQIAMASWAGLLTVGALGAWIADGAEQGGMPREALVRCGTHAEAAAALKRLAAPGDAVLLKASRGEKLERVVEEWERLDGVPPHG